VTEAAKLHCICNNADFATAFTYDAPPPGETRFVFSANGNYRREVFQCKNCGHFISRHEMSDEVRYTGDYVDATYGTDDGMRRQFDRINALEPAKSDNIGRVRRVLEFAERHFGQIAGNGIANPHSILDVGSGLCVFLHRMKAAGWDCTALDPDPRAVKHAQEVVGVKGICADFMEVNRIDRFEVIAFNKVLEHVADPVLMLAKAREYLSPHGFVYVEVPDGECAALAGPNREEFFIDHLHVFSAASLALLSRGAGFTVCAIERLQEPSTKYTLRAFLNEPTKEG
jgi:SAM-dependent methyltransferase